MKWGKSDYLFAVGISFFVSIVWTVSAAAVTRGSGLLFIVGMILLIVWLFKYGYKRAGIAVLSGWIGLGILSLIYSYQPSGRFQMVPGNPAVALDTKTGQRCLTGPRPDTTTDKQSQQPAAAGDPWAQYIVKPSAPPLPYCVDLK
jgi:hypothetical protein